jgi:T5SS/PEP-CTERM-associated repeat protein
MLSQTPATRSGNTNTASPKGISRVRSVARWRSFSAQAALIISAAVCVPLHAQNIPWTNAAGGTFNTAANWNGGVGPVPVAANTAQFIIPNTYTTTFNLSPTNTGLTVGGSNVSFRADTLASRTYTVTGNATVSGGSLTLAAPSSGSNTLSLNIGNELAVNVGRTLTVNAGNDVSSATFALGTNAIGTATATFDGSGSTLTVASNTFFGLNGGVGNLTLQNNASASFASLTVTSSSVNNSGGNILVQSGADITSLGNLSLGSGTASGQVSSFTVTGAGSTVVQTSLASNAIGAASTSSASLEISAGGTFTTGTGLTTVNPTGTISISGATLNLKGNLTVAGGSLNQLVATGAVLNWDPSRTMTVNSGGQVNLAQNFETPNAATINVSGASSQVSLPANTLTTRNANIAISAGGLLSMGELVLGTDAGRVSTLTVDGAGSSLAIAGGTPLIGTNNGTGSLTFSNGATGNFPTTSFVETIVGNPSGSDGATGSLSVLSGADVTMGNLRISNGNTTTGTVTVGGSGSTLTQTGTSFLAIGSSGGAPDTGQLILNTSGTITTGTGGLFINASGRLSQAGGTLLANGNITVVDGTLSQTDGIFSWAAAKAMSISSGGVVSLRSFSSPTDSVITLTDANSTLNTNNSSITINQGSSLTVTNGADVLAAQFLDIATSGDATVIVNGAGSTLTSSAFGASFLGTDGNGQLTVRNNASVSYPGGLRIAGSGASSTGTLNVESGATFSSGTLEIGSGGATTAVATMNVTGGTVTVSGNRNVTIGLNFSIDLPDSVNVNAGGVFNVGTGTTVISTSGRLNVAAGTFNTSGLLDVAGIANFTAGASVNVAPTASTRLLPGGVINIIESDVNLGNLNPSGGTLNFISGSLGLTGNLVVGTSGLLGNNLTLDATRSLTLSGSTTINAQRQLNLVGGRLTTSTLINNGTFNFTAGTLSLTGPAGFTIGSGGALGATVLAGAGTTYNITGLTTVSSNGRLIIADGTFNATGGIANSGEIRLAGLTPSLTGGLITNSKLIRGDGRIDNSLTNTATGELRAEAGNSLILAGANGTNTGRINLLGGSLQFIQPLTNGAAGIVSGTGFLHADAGMTNNGQVQFSAGFTSVFGGVTNNNQIIVSGGGTASFYGGLVMSPGSTFQTSTNSTAVFFGPVTGAGSFTGPGVKNFEGGGPGSLIGAIATITGTTRVGPGTTVETGSFDEAAVTIDGALLLTAGRNISRTSALSINTSGLLDLTDNDLIVDYDTATSPIGTLISYLTSGQLLTSGDLAGLPTYLAISEAADLGLTEFGGIAVDDTAVLAKFTYVGDANLDGQVDALDYERVDLAIGNSGVFGTAQGDLNYDGIVDALDYEQIDLNIGNGVGSPLGGVFIPEPASLSLVAVGAALMGRRRRA